MRIADEFYSIETSIIFIVILGDECTCDAWCRKYGHKNGGICGDGHTCICSSYTNLFSLYYNFHSFDGKVHLVYS